MVIWRWCEDNDFDIIMMMIVIDVFMIIIDFYDDCHLNYNEYLMIMII
jgi:hypothetical protein